MWKRVVIFLVGVRHGGVFDMWGWGLMAACPGVAIVVFTGKCEILKGDKLLKEE